MAMADTSGKGLTTSGRRDPTTTKAVKDRTCPYCHQAFTSSSLGRHLDLYIREKNPKAPDGIHDVEAIRKLRQNITRRQPRSGVARRTASIGGTLTASSRKSSASEDPDSSINPSPVSHRDSLRSGYLTVDDGKGGRDIFDDGWGARRLGRVVDKQVLKAQLDMRQRIQDAEDTSRAAELALRELLGSLRAAKLLIDIESPPFDFDPFALDFPALTLQCLEPPPTLFATTQHPTPTSWSILPPGHVQLEALHAYFRNEFKRWKTACAAAAASVAEESVDASSPSLGDPRTRIAKAEKAAEQMEGHVYDHLAATYSIWNGLGQEQREQLWRLELARSVGRKQQEVKRLKEAQHLLRQEVANLKSQLDQVTQPEQPKPFRIPLPPTLYLDEKLLTRAMEEGIVSRGQYVGVGVGDHQPPLDTLISSIISRWKDVIATSRAATAGLQAQRSLDTAAALPSDPSPRSSTGNISPSASTHQPLHLHSRQSSANINLNISVSGAGGPGTSGYLTSAAASTDESLTPRIPSTPAVLSRAPSISIQEADEQQAGGASSEANREDDDDQEMQDHRRGEEGHHDPDRHPSLVRDDEEDDDVIGDDADGETDADADADPDADGDADMDDVSVPVSLAGSVPSIPATSGQQGGGGFTDVRFAAAPAPLVGQGLQQQAQHIHHQHQHQHQHHMVGGIPMPVSPGLAPQQQQQQQMGLGMVPSQLGGGVDMGQGGGHIHGGMQNWA